MANPRTSAPPSEASNDQAPWRGTARYEVVGCLGRGGMGVVYEVFDRQRHERVALKMLLRFDARNLYRFKQEFRTLADVVHPNLVHLHELVADERDELHFTMELVEGADFLGHVQKGGTPRVAGATSVITMDTAVRRARRTRGTSEAPASVSPGPLSPSPADFDKLRLALRQLVEGVCALHAAGKLHRDLKPSNVRVTRDGRVVILDFGVATELKPRRRKDAVEEEEVVGTVTYMAPEQASGEPPVAASDWYSVGALLYEAIVGNPPFGGSPVDVLTLKYTSTPLAPSECVEGVPRDLDALCQALLAADPENRPDGAEILRRLGATASDRAPGPRIADGPGATLLVGREEHLRALGAAFEATRDGAMSVRVSGLSGLGKSAVVNHFLDEVDRRDDVLVLRGRAYERESMPYKAVDSVIDALSRRLMDMERPPLPRETWALAHLFPVLRRVPSIDAIPKAPTGDVQVIRQLAFGALRELFTSLSEKQRVVVFVDDAQWGDTDSASLLLALMGPPAAPPILLVTTHRAEEAETSPFLTDLRARWPEEAPVREVTIGPLAFEEARRLAIALLGTQDSSAQHTAENVARESGGSPFLLEELARGASAHHRIAVDDGAAPPSVRLDDLIAQRAARLPVDARSLLEVIAVGGRPLPLSAMADAAGVGEAAPQLVALLRDRRFVRAGLRDGRDVVEASHDRVRQTIVAHLPPEALRERHAQLARVLEATPESDPEAIAAHLAGAGDPERAAHYAERAAGQAAANLAFAQAARLFQTTLDATDPSSPDALRLARRVAETSEWAGYPEKAARAYLFAAERAPTIERVALERAAAAQLIAAGRIDESAVVGRRVLDAVGRSVPESALATVFWIVLYRVAWAVMLRSKLGPARDLTPEERVRLDALHALGRGLAVTEPVAAMYVKARYMVDALRSGSRAHVVLAAAAEASSLAAQGGQPKKHERALFEMARSLSEKEGDRAGRALYEITYGVCQFLRGDWRASLARLDGICAKLAAMRHWNANANTFAVYALVYLGDLREVKARTIRLVADAEQRGDLYTAINLRASHPIAAWLGSDDVEGARRQLRESMDTWSKTRFLVQHWQSMLWESEVELYAGQGGLAWDRLQRDAAAVRRSRLLGLQFVAILTHFVRGRSAIASLEGLHGSSRPGRLAAGRASERALRKQAAPWATTLADMMAASLADVTGDRDGAREALRRAAEGADAAEMALHAAAARRQLGTLLGGEEGATMVRDAEDTMKARGVRVPGRYAGMLLPGRWSPRG